MRDIEILRFDARGLNHPEPLEQSVKMMKKLNDYNCMHLHIHRYPQPLLMIAKSHGIRFELKESDGGEWHIIFTKNPKLDLRKLLEEIDNVQSRTLT